MTLTPAQATVLRRLAKGGRLVQIGEADEWSFLDHTSMIANADIRALVDAGLVLVVPAECCIGPPGHKALRELESKR